MNSLKYFLALVLILSSCLPANSDSAWIHKKEIKQILVYSRKKTTLIEDSKTIKSIVNLLGDLKKLNPVKCILIKRIDLIRDYDTVFVGFSKQNTVKINNRTYAISPENKYLLDSLLNIYTK